MGGANSQDLHFLANLSPEVSEAEANWSVIGKLAHRPAVNWTKIYATESWLTAMTRSPHGRLFAVSIDGNLYSNRTGTWTVTDLGCPPLNAVWAATEDAAFAVGDKGACVQITGTAIDATSIKAAQDLYGVNGTSQRHVVAVGNDGAVLRFDGTSWIAVSAVRQFSSVPGASP